MRESISTKVGQKRLGPKYSTPAEGRSFVTPLSLLGMGSFGLLRFQFRQGVGVFGGAVKASFSSQEGNSSTISAISDVTDIYISDITAAFVAIRKHALVCLSQYR